MRPPWRLLGVLLFAVLAASCALLVLSALQAGAIAVSAGLLVSLGALLLWIARHRRALHISLDPHILDVRTTRLGPCYRIPLADIKDVRLLNVETRPLISLTLADDRSELGEGFSPRELAWLADVVREAVVTAGQRPIRREGLPDEVPAQLAALKERQRT